LHESVINYAGNQSPELITCLHEDPRWRIAHGYAKIAGKPMAVFAPQHGGLQHAAMGIFNAYCDRVPVYIVLGNTLDETMRRPGVEWDHSVQDAAAMVRDYTKWDDLPISLTHFAESAVRAYKIAMTPPIDAHPPGGRQRSTGAAPYPPMPRCAFRSSPWPRRRREIQPPSPKPRACWSPRRIR